MVDFVRIGFALVRNHNGGIPCSNDIHHQYNSNCKKWGILAYLLIRYFFFSQAEAKAPYMGQFGLETGCILID